MCSTHFKKKTLRQYVPNSKCNIIQNSNRFNLVKMQSISTLYKVKDTLNLHLPEVHTPSGQTFKVRLFICFCFFVSLENFSFIWRRQNYWEQLQILTYALHSWPFSSEGHCYKGQPVIMVISEDP